MKFFNAFTHSIVAGSLLVACQVVASPLHETVTTIASINETLNKIEQRPNRADDELTLKVKNGRLQVFSTNERVNEKTWSFDVYRLDLAVPVNPVLGLHYGLPVFDKTGFTNVGDLRRSLSGIETQNAELSGSGEKVIMKSTIKIPVGEKPGKSIVHISTLLSLFDDLKLADSQGIHIDTSGTYPDELFVFALPRENGAAATVYGMNYYDLPKVN